VSKSIAVGLCVYLCCVQKIDNATQGAGQIARALTSGTLCDIREGKLSFLLVAVAHITIVAASVQWIKDDLRKDIA